MAESSIASDKHNAKEFFQRLKKPEAASKGPYPPWLNVPKKFPGVGDQVWQQDDTARRWKLVSGRRDWGERGLISDVLRKKVDEVIDPKPPLFMGVSVGPAQYTNFSPLGAVLYSANMADYGYPGLFNYAIYSWDWPEVNFIGFQDIQANGPIVEITMTPGGWEPVWTGNLSFGWISRNNGVHQGEYLEGFQIRSTVENTGWTQYFLTSTYWGNGKQPGPATIDWAVAPSW